MVHAGLCVGPALAVGQVRASCTGTRHWQALVGSSSAPRARLSTSAASAAAFDLPVLKGSCTCGSVGWEAKGPSALNFTCHCSVCRGASGQPYVQAAGFKPEQVEWVNKAGMVESLPPGSRNKRYHCKCCGSYIGEDATRPLGILALPLSAAVNSHGRATGAITTPAAVGVAPAAGVDLASIPEEYRPNHHIFYANRVVDVADNAPKWVTLPQGELVDGGGARQDTQPVYSQGDAPSPWGTTTASRSMYDSAAGRLRKDVLPTSPPRPPYPLHYHFTEMDPIPNHTTYVAPEKVQERVARKYNPSPGKYVAPGAKRRDVIIIGGGHNGLVTAAYLAKQGLDVVVLERRGITGGAAVTEELIPGFKFSRASYLAGLLRPVVVQDLELEKYGFKLLPRNPSSFTPSLLHSAYKGKYLMLGSDAAKNHQSISQFSVKDADNYERYEAFLGKVREIVSPLLDNAPPQPNVGGLRERLRTLGTMMEVGVASGRHRDVLVPFYELFTAPASHILDRWFDSEILKTTLATDAVIGALCSPTQAGSAYVLLHHVMGEAAGQKGVWAYVEGGMGSVSKAIEQCAKSRGVEVVTNATVSKILYQERLDGSKPRAQGVKMADGSELYADVVVSNATPYHTFLELMPGLSRDSGNMAESSPLPADFQHHIRFADYGCGAFKINCAVDRLPNFECYPSPSDGSPGPMHFGTAHFENRMEELEFAHREASMGMPATRPIIEMTIPSSLDRTISPPGKHVVQFFVQYAPYEVDPKYGNWADEGFKNAFADRVFSIVDEFCPGFSSSVIGRDLLSPLDLERVFGMHKGNIHHGSLSLHQLGYARPMAGYSSYRTPMDGLYLCGAGTHPGGGVMGAPGRNCANVILSDKGLA